MLVRARTVDQKEPAKKNCVLFYLCLFRLRRHAKVELDPGPNVAGYETHRVPSYDLDTPSDALENQIGPSVWPLRCFEVIKPKPQKTEIWEIPVLSIGTFIGSQ